jgi:hypothetical protein
VAGAALETSIIIWHGRRSNLVVSWYVFFAYRIVKAASSEDNVQIPLQARHFVTCDEN